MMTQERTHKSGHETNADKHPRHIPHVLIIDDDVDAAMAVDAVFRAVGCETEFAFTPKDAQRKLSAALADIVILDWRLDTRVCADEVLAQAIAWIDKFVTLQRRAKARRPKIITYSGVDKHSVHLPQSEYYEHLAHWEKPLGPSEAARKTLSLLTGLGF